MRTAYAIYMQQKRVLRQGMDTSHKNFEQSEWRGLPCFDFFGRKTHLTLREILDRISHIYYGFFIVTVVILLMLFDLHQYQEVMSIGALFVLWTMFMVVMALVYTFLLIVSVYISQKIDWFFVLTPIVGLVSMAVSTFLLTYFAAMFSGQEYTFGPFFKILPTNIAIGIIFHIGFDYFVQTQIDANLLEKRALKEIEELKKASSNLDRSITISGQLFPVKQLYTMQSQDHYIEVKTLDTKVLLRARLADAVSQIPEGVGIMPHRSFWVSRHAVTEMGGSSEARTLILTDETEVPVARGRIADVRKWLAKQTKPE